MLNVTQHAATMIRTLLKQTHASTSTGLRIAQRDDHPALAMTLTDQPGPYDVVLVEHDVSVYLGPAAADRIHDQTLDADTTQTKAAFYLRD